MKFEATVKEIIPRTSDISSFRFARPAELSFKPGQYMLVTLRSGQKELMHPFSFSSSPTEEDHIEFTKKFTSSEYSAVLRSLKTGDWTSIDAPYGMFTFEGEYPKIALLTGGIGITPFRSILQYCNDKHLSTSVVLLYGCRAPNEIAFGDEMEEMQKQNKNLKVVLTVNEPNEGWKGPVGNITVELVKKEVPDYQERIFFACGPPGMVQAMTNLIKQLDLPEAKMRLESFVGH